MGDVIFTLKLHIICKKKQRKILPLIYNSAYCKHNKVENKAKDLRLNSVFFAQSYCYLVYSIDSDPASSHVKHKNQQIKYQNVLPSTQETFNKYFPFSLNDLRAQKKQQLKVLSANCESLKILWQDNKTASQC